jgi:hypothetical protein
MSSITQRKHTCPSCRLEQEFGLRENVNVTLEPELKKPLLERQLAKFKCQGCGRTLQIQHALLYNDVREKFLVWLPHKDVQPSIVEGSVVMNMMGKAGYKFRSVESYNDLVEKIRIFDDHHDDRALELLKLEFTTRKQIPPAEKLFYDGLVAKAAGQKVLRLTQVKKGGPISYELPLEELNRHTAVLSKVGLNAMEQATWLRVDREYVAQLAKAVK